MKIKNTILPIILLHLFACSITSCLEEDFNAAREGAIIYPMTHIYEIREVYQQEDVNLGPDVLNGSYITSGVVISENGEKNIPDNQIVLQSTDEKSTLASTKKCRGIIISLDTRNPFVFGDSLVIDLRGSVLKNIEGNLQITGLGLDQITKAGSGIQVAPLTITVKDLHDNFSLYSSMLVSVIADIYPLPEMGETLSGDKRLAVSNEDAIFLHTKETAAFANETVMPSAQYTGITYWNQDKKQLWMRKGSDMQDGSGPVYPNWPEDFEEPSIEELKMAANGGLIPKSMTSYNSGDNLGAFKTGIWYMFNAILVDPVLSGTSGRDRISGKQGIRMQQNLSVDAYMQMNFDVKRGASKVTFTYGSYYNDASCTFCLEYSQDGGTSWTQLGDWITNPDKIMQVASYKLDIDGNVRFRINKKGLGSTSTATGVKNGRLSIDNFYIYQNSWE